MLKKVLLLGDPRLRKISREVKDFKDPQLHREMSSLKSALERFRREMGFGRGIAAPQIGINKRFIALNLGNGPFMVVNPLITWHSKETFTLWDDCMSFPDLLVKVRRCTSISLTFRDESGNIRKWEKLGRARSELLQHEIDHLDGILAVDRAIDEKSVMYKSVFNENKHSFQRQVDYVIQPKLKSKRPSS